MVVDPVCGMALGADRAVGFELDGQVRYFCSRGCRAEFLESAAAQEVVSS
jgi:YHS domain-containing protein